jgi:capsular exopolysaccharide synthesis family protein
MSRYFNQSRRQIIDHAMPTAAAKQADLSRVLDEVTQSGTIPQVKKVIPLSACRKFSLPESSDQPLVLAKSDVAPQVRESYRALRTRLLRMQASVGLRSVILSSAMSREGKTLTSINLALTCSRLNSYRVLVIDCDLRTRGLTRLLGNPAGPGLSEILAGKAEYEDAIMATENPNLYVLGAGSLSMHAPELYAGTQWKELMSWCNENFKLVIVDSPPILPVADFEQIVGSCDGVLMVVRAYQTQRELLGKTVSRLDPKKLIGVILNGLPASETSEYATDYSGAYTDVASLPENQEQDSLREAGRFQSND